MKGFTLVETLVGVFIFLIIALGIYQGFFAASKIVTLSKIQTEAALLADEQFELIRNMPYQEVGLVNGIPRGVLSPTGTFVRSGVTFLATTTIRDIDDPFDGLFPQDTTPADYKRVTLTIGCADCVLTAPLSFTTTVAPKNLENSTGNGALFVTAIDANGQLLPGANVHVENDQLTPIISIDDVTSSNGQLQLVDMPPSNLAYAVTVTKPGYSTSQTYATTQDNPNPSPPYATVAAGQLTNLSLAIDRLGQFNVFTQDRACKAVPNLPFALTGAKLIGTNPPILKYSQTLATDANGFLSLPGLEWDTYTFTPQSSSEDFVGSAPFNPVALVPGATENVNLVMTPHNPKGLLVAVTDGGSGLPLAGAAVILSAGGFNQTAVTDQGSLTQTDWSGGAGQTDFVDPTRYQSDDGGVDVTSSPGNVLLRQSLGSYVSSGSLTSSVFDTGSSTNSVFYNLTWNPQTQPPTAGADSLKFQVATAPDDTATTSWNFSGPDGTASSFYTVTANTISASNNGARYFRYRAYLTTADPTVSPELSDVAVTYGNGCLPYGQVYFGGLAGGPYTLTVSDNGYQTWSGSVTVNNDWQQTAVPLQPL